MHGPLMMVALNPSEDLSATPLSLPEGLATAPRNGDEFEYAQAGRTVRFKPFYSVRDETYNTYFTKQV
jgi:hypothetical protein